MESKSEELMMRRDVDMDNSTILKREASKIIEDMVPTPEKIAKDILDLNVKLNKVVDIIETMSNNTDVDRNILLKLFNMFADMPPEKQRETLHFLGYSNKTAKNLVRDLNEALALAPTGAVEEIVQTQPTFLRRNLRRVDSS